MEIDTYFIFNTQSTTKEVREEHRERRMERGKDTEREGDGER